ncbi:MAG: DUF4179 domain-containing protein [Evtepia sp.]
MKLRISQLVDSLQPDDISLEEKPFDRTAAVKGEVYRRIRRQAAEQPAKKRRTLGRLPLAAAIALICLATTAAAAVTVHLHPAILDYFGVGQGRESLVEPGADSPVCTVAKNGVTVSVLQTVADSYGVYVFYEVKVPEEITLPEWVIWDNYDIEPPHASDAFFCSQNQEILEISDHHMVGAVTLFSASQQVEQGPITVSFRDLGYYNENQDFVLLAQGQWSLTWTLHNIQPCTTSHPNQRVQTGNGEATINTIAISAISFNLISDGAKLSEEPISLRFADGSTLPVDMASAGGTLGSVVSHMTDAETERYTCQVSNLFDNAIDPAQVTAVVIGETVLPFPE